MYYLLLEITVFAVYYIAKTVIIVNAIIPVIDVGEIPANVISYPDLKINTNQLVHR